MKAIISYTFYTELNKKLQISGIIPTSTIGIESTTKLVRPENSLNFNVINEKYMDHIVLQQEDIRKPGKIETRDAKVTNFSILSTKPKRRIGSKGKMSYQIIDEIKIVGLQNRSLNEKSNPVEITIHEVKYNQNYLGTATNVINIASLLIQY